MQGSLTANTLFQNTLEALLPTFAGQHVKDKQKAKIFGVVFSALPMFVQYFYPPQDTIKDKVLADIFTASGIIANTLLTAPIAGEKLFLDIQKVLEMIRTYTESYKRGGVKSLFFNIEYDFWPQEWTARGRARLAVRAESTAADKDTSLATVNTLTERAALLETKQGPSAAMAALYYARPVIDKGGQILFALCGLAFTLFIYDSTRSAIKKYYDDKIPEFLAAVCIVIFLLNAYLYCGAGASLWRAKMAAPLAKKDQLLEEALARIILSQRVAVQTTFHTTRQEWRKAAIDTFGATLTKATDTLTQAPKDPSALLIWLQDPAVQANINILPQLLIQYLLNEGTLIIEGQPDLGRRLAALFKDHPELQAEMEERCIMHFETLVEQVHNTLKQIPTMLPYVDNTGRTLAQIALPAATVLPFTAATADAFAKFLATIPYLNLHRFANPWIAFCIMNASFGLFSTIVGGHTIDKIRIYGQRSLDHAREWSQGNPLKFSAHLAINRDTWTIVLAIAMGICTAGTTLFQKGLKGEHESLLAKAAEAFGEYGVDAATIFITMIGNAYGLLELFAWMLEKGSKGAGLIVSAIDRLVTDRPPATPNYARLGDHNPGVGVNVGLHNVSSQLSMQEGDSRHDSATDVPDNSMTFGGTLMGQQGSPQTQTDQESVP
jgi:hypothetical protein